MSLSPEVQAQADEIRRNKSLVKSLQGERDLWKQKAGEAYGKLDELAGKSKMSDEDRDEIKRQSAELDALNDELEGAAHENTSPSQDGASGGQPVGVVEPVPPPNDPEAPRPDPIAGTGNNGTVPLMPNMAFDPAGGVKPPPGDAGQPNQAPTIETAGGFVVSGGGNTARAPGSRPESPSSSVVVPTDPDAKAPVSTADEVKSGLGDSSQNALIGNDLQPVADGPGIPKEPSEAAARKEQERQELLAKEQERRRANPLNLSDEDLRKQQEADAGKGTALDPDGRPATGGAPQPPASPAS